MSVGQKIKARRKQLGISAELLADKLGVSPSTIYRYENGAIEKVDAAKLTPIAEALNTTPAYLMDWTDDDSADLTPEKGAHHTKEARILISGIEKMPEEAQKRMLDMARLLFDKHADYFKEGETKQ